MDEKQKKIRIGVLISGSGSNLQAILDACKKDDIYGDVVCVGSDSEDAYGLKRAEKEKIPTFVVNYRPAGNKGGKGSLPMNVPSDFNLESVLEKQNLFTKESRSENSVRFFSKRAISECELYDKVAPYQLDLLVLAGYMRILTPYFIDRFTDSLKEQKIMNIHPALLPAFPGEDGYGDTFRFGCKVAGCTVHFVDYGADTGPIIGQRAFTIASDDTLEQVKEKGLALEWALYPECIDLFARGKLETVRLTFENKKGVFQRTVVNIVQ